MADIEVRFKAAADIEGSRKAGEQMAKAVAKGAGQASGGAPGAGGGTAGGGGDAFSQMKAQMAAQMANMRSRAGALTPPPVIKPAGFNIPIAASVGIAAAAVAVGLYALQRAVAAIVPAMERAAQLYAKQLQSGGLPIGFVSQRSSLSRVMGVGEQEVWQYGNAVKYLNNRLKFSAEINAQTNRSVTGVAWAVRIVGEDFKSLGMLLANEVAPSIRKVATAVHYMIVNINPGLITFASNAVKNMMEFVSKQVIGAPATNFLRGFYERMLKHVGDPGPAPEAAVSMKRMQSSHWERMGLIVGQGTSNHPLKAVERHTRSAAETLKAIKEFMSPRAAGNPRLAGGTINSP